MADTNNKASLLKTRIFLLLFFGLAVLLSATTILGTWEAQREGTIDPPAANNPLTTPVPAK